MIRSGNIELIHTVIRTFTRENEALVDQLTSIIYWMRGAITRDESWSLSYLEREKFVEFLNKRFEDARDMYKNGLNPFL